MKALNFLLNLKQSRDFDGNLESSLDEAIAELEALQSRSCEGCKHGKERYWDCDSGRYDMDVSFECKRLDKSRQLTPYSKYEEHKFYCPPTFCCNNYELKE